MRWLAAEKAPLPSSTDAARLAVTIRIKEKIYWFNIYAIVHVFYPSVPRPGKYEGAEMQERRGMSFTRLDVAGLMFLAQAF
jgi:hypothetical protein